MAAEIAVAAAQVEAAVTEEVVEAAVVTEVEAAEEEAAVVSEEEAAVVTEEEAAVVTEEEAAVEEVVPEEVVDAAVQGEVPTSWADELEDVLADLQERDNDEAVAELAAAEEAAEAAAEEAEEAEEAAAEASPSYRPGDAAAAAAHVPASEQTGDGAASGLEAEWTHKAAKGEVKKKRMPMLNSDKYEEVNIPRLAEWDPSTTKLDGTVVAIGKRRTGKSFAFRHILHSLAEHFPAGICISQTDELNKYWRQYMPSKYIFSKFEPEILHAIFDRQKSILNDPRLTEEEREKKARFFIILDDVISMLPPLAIGILLVGVIVLSLAACALLVASSYYLVLLIAFHNDKRIRYDAAIAELFVAGRHYKLFTMITTQYAKAITPTLRSNADYVLILHNKQEGQREALWRDFADFMTKEAFYTLMDAYTQDNEVLIVDTSDSTAKPWEVLKWFKASDPGEFLLGDEEYWSSLNSSNTVPAQNFDLPINSMQLVLPSMQTMDSHQQQQQARRR
ncbi:hypothetical protein T492DRAFT_894602 [Pavlovales sp. CCMP2436]|nr:hypothetical protein T492DRAFT_894602 [Pavlovales sp. CCMP2436]